MANEYSHQENVPEAHKNRWADEVNRNPDVTMK